MKTLESSLVDVWVTPKQSPNSQIKGNDMLSALTNLKTDKNAMQLQRIEEGCL